jgi:hypothetical protein
MSLQLEYLKISSILKVDKANKFILTYVVVGRIK